MIKIYCEACGTDQPMAIEPMRSDDLNGAKIWGDLLCSKCGFVIATLTVDEPGTYEFTKVLF